MLSVKFQHELMCDHHGIFPHVHCFRYCLCLRASLLAPHRLPGILEHHQSVRCQLPAVGWRPTMPWRSQYRASHVDARTESKHCRTLCGTARSGERTITGRQWSSQWPGLTAVRMGSSERQVRRRRRTVRQNCCLLLPPLPRWSSEAQRAC